MSDTIYAERDMCVSLIAKMAQELGYKVGIQQTEDPAWPLVFINLPTGQVSWHVKREELEYFPTMRPYNEIWDGHTTEQKYKRVTDYEPSRFYVRK
jgi:hypothetical protein